MDDMAKIAGVPPPPRYPIEPLMTAARENEDPARLCQPKPSRPEIRGG